MVRVLNIAVFASGRGSNFEALHRTIGEENIPARIAVVISNNSAAGALNLARSFGIPALHLSQRQFPGPADFHQAVLQSLAQYRTDLIVLAGYMKKMDAAVVRAYSQRIINIHPALLPKFGGEGMYGMHVHAAVLAAGETESGASVHYVDEEYDRGAVIAQQRVPVLPGDTPETLAARVLTAEHTLLPSVVKQIALNHRP
ncbi:MAG: phosphoribosylglycinamide formyltransferase [Bacteroidetes bacterium]|nr:phosphoribosylglycinamide formyltransferase [Bacteroidota bacterium]